MQATQEQWEQEARASLAWAQGARERARKGRRDRRLFAILAAVVTFAAVGGTLLVIAPKAQSHHGKKCHTEKCRDRVWNRQHPFRPALASWYDAVALGGRMGCPPYRYQGGYVVAHKTMACGTRVRVCFRRCVTAYVGDRGPYSGAREFDLDKPGDRVEAPRAQAEHLAGPAKVRPIDRHAVPHGQANRAILERALDRHRLARAPKLLRRDALRANVIVRRGKLDIEV